MAARGARPLAAELIARSYNALAMSGRGGWLRFVDERGDLAAQERDALMRRRAWFDALEPWRWRGAASKMKGLLSWVEQAREHEVNAMPDGAPLDEQEREAVVRLSVDGSGRGALCDVGGVAARGARGLGAGESLEVSRGDAEGIDEVYRHGVGAAAGRVGGGVWRGGGCLRRCGRDVA
jgi:hypothetical protein